MYPLASNTNRLGNPLRRVARAVMKPVDETPTKPGRPATGLDFIRYAAERARGALEPRPWFAVGGIGVTTLPDVIAAGAVRIVVVRAITDSPDAAAAVRRLIEILPPNP